MNNAKKAVEESKINAKQTEIKEAIAKKIIVSSRSITIEDIIEQLEKQGIVNIGDANSETGQVKTQPDGYVYEIEETTNGDWKVTYQGNGEITKPEVVIALSVNTTGITNEVIITMIAKAESGITSYTLPQGTAQSVAGGTKEITKTITATENGTYVFTIVNGNGERVTKSIKVDNILNNAIQMSASTTMPTANNVTITITWPEGSSGAVKQIQVGEGEWQTVTGSASQVTVSENCTVRARVRNSVTNIIGNSVTVGNIDKAKPIITGTVATIDYGSSNEVSKYFTVEANGIGEVADVKYIDTSNGNAEVENTNTLTLGTHEIKCVATKETGVTGSATVTIEVEPLVFGNLYKISDTEYHLIFNGTGAIAQGYSESQLVARGDNIKDGIDTYVEVSTGVYISSQPWGPYSENITKVKIAEKIKPRSTARYFYYFPKITEIEGLENLDTKNVVSMRGMFEGCNSITSIDVSNWNTSKVTDMHNVFCDCWELTSVDVSKWDTGKVEEMQGVFARCYKLERIDVSEWDTSNVTNMKHIFDSCNSLTSINVNSWDTSSATMIDCIFYGCSSLTSIDANNWDTSSVTTMSRAFSECSNLSNLYINNWETCSVENMGAIFEYCDNLTSLDLNDWDIGSCKYLTMAFYSCKGLTDLNVSNWNISNVTVVRDMFAHCDSLTTLDLSNWNTSKVENMWGLFYSCDNLTTIYVGDNWSNASVTESTNMFVNSTKLVGSNGTVSYSSSNTNQVNMANHINGYFTRKMEADCAYFEDFNANTYSNYTYSGATVASCTNSVLKLTTTNGDPQVYMKLPESKYFNPKEYRYLHVRYRITANNNWMVFYMVPNPTDQTYFLSQTITVDGEWHTAVFDLSTNSSVWNLSQITGMRFDPINSSGATVEIDYIGISSKSE